MGTSIYDPSASPPCDACALNRTCSLARLACEAYAAYCWGKPWEGIPRVPTLAIFKRLHPTPIASFEEQERKLAELRKRRLESIFRHGKTPGRKPKAVSCG